MVCSICCAERLQLSTLLRKVRLWYHDVCSVTSVLAHHGIVFESQQTVDDLNGTIAELEAVVGTLESDRDSLVVGTEAVLAGLESIKAEADDHEERLALLEGELSRIELLEEDAERISALEEKVKYLGVQLVCFL